MRRAGVLALVVTTLAVAAALDTPAASAAASRLAWLVPVALGAVTLGTRPGALVALLAVSFRAPDILAGVERDGLTAVTFDAAGDAVVLLAAAVMTGSLAAAARLQRRRYEALGAVQRVLAIEAPLERTLRRVIACLDWRLGCAALTLTLRDGDAVATASAGCSALAASGNRDPVTREVLRSGRIVYLADAGGQPRPRRVLGAPLTAAGVTIGALVAERTGELSPPERETLVMLAAHVGLGLENARLAAMNRRAASELDTKIAAATHRLAEADRAKSAIVALASHELRTPLAALLGFSELLATRDFARDEVRRLAGIVRRETARLARLVDDVLDLSRIERGLPVPLGPRRVAVAAALEAAVEIFAGVDADGTGRRFAIECEAALPRVVADPDALDRIVKNLIANAVKYSPPGSPVGITARAVEGAVEVTVADAGRGIAPEARARVFEPYYRAPDVVRGVPGTGLGLAVVKALVEAHGGTITLDSAPGAGTRVTFRLPIAREASSAAPVD